jgi:hypothetical protein
MEASTWTAGVLLYSGRRDPEWSIPDATTAGLQVALDGLPELAGASQAPSRLGYRGAWVRTDDGRRVVAFNGRVTGQNGRSRADPERAFERAILETAPAGVLPVGADALFSM